MMSNRKSSAHLNLACAALLAAATALVPGASAGAQAQPAVGTSHAPSQGRVRGTLLIVGGGTQPQSLVQEFVDLAGGRGHARIAILPMASEESAASGKDKKVQLDSMGADAFVVDVTREQADADSIVKLLSTATGVWFPGGDQARLTAHLQGSAALRTIQERYRDGAVIGGTSAGAAIMSDSMLTGNQFFPGSLSAHGEPAQGPPVPRITGPHPASRPTTSRTRTSSGSRPRKSMAASTGTCSRAA